MSFIAHLYAKFSNPLHFLHEKVVTHIGQYLYFTRTQRLITTKAQSLTKYLHQCQFWWPLASCLLTSSWQYSHPKNQTCLCLLTPPSKIYGNKQYCLTLVTTKATHQALSGIKFEWLCLLFNGMVILLDALQGNRFFPPQPLRWFPLVNYLP